MILLFYYLLQTSEVTQKHVKSYNENYNKDTTLNNS